MRAKDAFAAFALVALGFGAGAWWMDARLALQIAALKVTTSPASVGGNAASQPGSRAPDVEVRGTTDAPRNVAAPISAATPASVTPRPTGMNDLPPAIAELIGRLQAMDKDFEAQKRDDAWAEKQERALRELVRNSPTLLPPGVELAQVDCRATLCRVWFTGAPKTMERLSSESILRSSESMRAISETFAAQRYGVNWTIVGRPDAAVDDYVFTLRPEALFQQPSVSGH